MLNLSPLLILLGPMGLKQHNEQSVGKFAHRAAFFTLMKNRLIPAFIGPPASFIFQGGNANDRGLFPSRGKGLIILALAIQIATIPRRPSRRGVD